MSVLFISIISKMKNESAIDAIGGIVNILPILWNINPVSTNNANKIRMKPISSR